MSKRRRGCRGGGGKRRNGALPYAQHDKALTDNSVSVGEYSQWMLSILLMRYKWDGLPVTCSARFLETMLSVYGVATLAYNRDEPGVFMSLGAGAFEEFNAYYEPVRWAAISMGTLSNSRELFPVERFDNGALCWDRASRCNFWPHFRQIAQKLARYNRTEFVNLQQQFTPFIAAAPETNVIDVETVLGAMLAGQVAVVGYKPLADVAKSSISVIDTGVEYKGEQFQRGALGAWSEFFRLAGIPVLQFEKTERMITGEAQSAYAPARLMIDDGLSARKEFCDEVNRVFGLSIDVEINPFIEELFATAKESDTPNGGEDNGDLRLA